MTWLDDYKAQLDAIVAAKQKSVSATGNPSLSNAYALLASAPVSSKLYGPDADYSGAKGGSGHSFGGAWNATKSGGLRLIDLLSRGTYASAGVANEASKAHAAGENHHEKLSKALGALPIAGTYLRTLAEGDISDELSAGWKGLKGEEKLTYSDVLKTRGVDSNAQRASQGFAMDVAFDPTTYMGFGLIGKGLRAAGVKVGTKVGKKATEDALEKPLERAAGDLAAHGTATADKATANDLLEFMLRQREAANTKEGLSNVADRTPASSASDRGSSGIGAEVAPKTAPDSTVFDFAPPGVKQDPEEIALLAARTASESATNILGKIPRRRYGSGTKIQPAFIEEQVAEVAKPVGKATKRVKMDSKRARALAMKQHILSNPNYQLTVTAGGKPVQTTVAKLRKIAEQNPEKAKMINSLLDNEAKQIAEKGPEFFSEAPGIRFTGREGTGQAGMSVDDFQRLLETGEVPKPAKGKTQDQTREFWDADAKAPPGASPLDRFGLHSDDDLANLHVSDVLGRREAIKDYLIRSGVKINRVDPLSEGGPVKGLEGTSEASKVGSGTRDADAGSGRETGTQAPSRARFRAMSQKEREAWIAAHKDILDEADIKLLLSTKISAADNSAWAKQVDRVLNKADKPGFDNIDDLMKALEDGRVSEADLVDLQKIVGAKTAKGIKRGLEKLFKQTAKLETEAGAKRAAKVDVSQWETPLPEVKPAEQIVEDVIEKGDLTDLTDIKATLDESQVTDLQAAMSHLVQREILDPQDLEKYGFVSRTGTKRTHSKMNQGVGRNLDQWSKWSQLTVVKGVITFRSTQVAEAVKASGLKGYAAVAARSRGMYDHVMPIMRTVDKILKQSGIPPMLSKNPRYSASLTDVLDAMPPAFVQKHFFSALKEAEHIPPTFWNDSAELVQDYAHGVIDYETAIHGVKDVLLEKVTTRTGKPIYTGIRTKFYKIAGAESPEAAEKYVLGVAKEFMRTAGAVKQVIEKNIAEVVINDANGAAKVTDEAMKNLTELVTSPGFTSHDLLRVANDRNAIVESVAKSAGITSERAKQLAKSDVEVKTAAFIPPEVAAAAHDAKAIATAKPAQIVPATIRSLDNTEVAVKQVMDEIGESLTDIGKGIERTMGWHVLKAFAPHLGNADIRPLFLSRNSFAQTTARAYTGLLSQISQQHAQRDIMAAWRELQNGTRPSVESVAAAHTELEKAVGVLFSKDPTYNIFKANGITAEQVNRHFSKFGISDKYRLNDTGYLKNWTKWETDNPLDLLSRFQAAIQTSKMERTLGADLSRRFGSRTGGPGMIKIKGGGILGQFIHPDMYFPRDIAEQMTVLNKAMEEMAKPASSNQALKLYDSALHAFKSGLTIYRPGHHIRNMTGDMWLSWMDGVNNPSVYLKSLYVMMDNNGRYTDFDAFKALTEHGVANPQKNSVVAKTAVKGKRVDLTTGQVYQLAYSRGLLPDYRTLEDVGGAVGNSDSIVKMPKIFGGKIHDAAATVSESRDHYIRIAHFIDLLNKSAGKSLDEIADVAAARVRKWHPDGSDLTNFESKVMRRGFVFYSWVRKAIPLVVESLVMKPGKVMVYPKAMYALAESMGVEPASFGDPFPQDQLFPSWIRDSVEGPMFEKDGHFFGVSPGIPAADVMNDYAASPKGFLGTILGSTTPVAKIPIEVTHGMQQGFPAIDSRTGAPKMDLSDYVDQQIPGVNVLANLTNRSPSSLFTQNTGEGNGMTPEQVALANEKNKPGMDMIALLNWLSGAGLMDMSKPSYIRQGQRERDHQGR